MLVSFWITIWGLPSFSPSLMSEVFGGDNCTEWEVRTVEHNRIVRSCRRVVQTPRILLSRPPPVVLPDLCLVHEWPILPMWPAPWTALGYT